MSAMAVERSMVGLLRAQARRRKRAQGRTLLRLYVASLPRSLIDWIAFAACSLFTVLCVIPAAHVLFWVGRMLGW